MKLKITLAIACISSWTLELETASIIDYNLNRMHKIEHLQEHRNSDLFIFIDYQTIVT